MPSRALGGVLATRQGLDETLPVSGLDQFGHGLVANRCPANGGQCSWFRLSGPDLNRHSNIDHLPDLIHLLIGNGNTSASPIVALGNLGQMPKTILSSHCVIIGCNQSCNDEKENTVKTMKALVKSKPETGLWLEEVPVPEIAHNDVLIKIIKTAICGTDVHIYNWDKWSQQTISIPMHIGHEFVGTIEAVGSHVTDFKPGDLVSGEGHLVCGHCRNCLAGRRHLCKETKGVGVNRPGAFAEYLSIPVTNVWYCNKTIPLDVLACFDPLGNATHTALSFDVLGEDVLITGAGPIGCMAASIAKHAGARYVVVTDVNPYRLSMAKKAGATLTVDVSRERIEDAQKQLGMKEGFDVAMEMSGNPAALTDILDNMCHGGKIAILGIMPDNAAIDWNKLVFNMLNIKGIYGREMYETWYKMTSMIQTGLDISPLITHKYHYTEFEKGFEVMRSGQSGKVILEWE